ncbi:MAG: TIGR04282 family arsenosugar biosynthesis glycosyltransferase [Verrucomicrobiota bacterium]
MFLKAPRLGQVKTRLAESLGAPAAAAAYREMVQALFHKIGRQAGLELRFAPDDAEREIRDWLGFAGGMRPQGAGDLGARMSRAFVDAFAEGAREVVVIGSDCPYLEVADLEAAWRALEHDDVVLGPASDGGYWLIGLRRFEASLFERIEWSTNSVLRHTVERAISAGLRVATLRQLADIDTGADWETYRKEQPDAARPR